MRPFTLTKWYLDCVDEAGRSAIAYWALLSWGRVMAAWQAVTIDDQAGSPVHRSKVSVAPATVRASFAAEPSWVNGSLNWASRAVGCRLSFTPRLEPFGARLLETDDGTVDWSCEAAAASVSFECDGRQPFGGTGYAERLILTMPPWRLPIDELRWGRWVSRDANRSVVWIDWRGKTSRTFVFVDGTLAQAATISGDTVTGGGLALALSDRRRLHERTLGELIRPLRPVLSKLPGGWLALEDRKWRSLGVLAPGGTATSIGWAIHEEIRWP